MSQQAASEPSRSTEDTPLGAIRRERVDEQIVRILVDAVVAGRWEPGSSLPPERELADQLSVNRTSLRLALARLEQIGLVRSRQGSGNVVQDPAELTSPEIIRAMLQQLGPEILDEMIEVRTGMGALIGRLAAAQATDAEIDRLRSAADAVEAATDPVARQQSEMSYFLELVGATHNRVLGALVRWVDSTYGRLPDEFAGAFSDATEVRSGIRSITDAVAARQPSVAAEAVERYFERSGAKLVATARATFDPQAP